MKFINMKYKNLTGRIFDLTNCRYVYENWERTTQGSTHNFGKLEIIDHRIHNWGHNILDRKECIYFNHSHGNLLYAIAVTELERTGQLTEKDLNVEEYELY